MLELFSIQVGWKCFTKKYSLVHDVMSAVLKMCVIFHELKKINGNVKVKVLKKYFFYYYYLLFVWFIQNKFKLEM